MNNRNLAYDNALAELDAPVAPVSYQAEVLRGQLCDDINRRFWRARLRLLRAFDDRKETVQRDHDRLSAEEFITKYIGWKFL